MEIKDLYNCYSNSDEYEKLDETKEVRTEKAKMHSFFKEHFNNDDFFTAVGLATSYAYTHEMRGFIIGFRCAMQIAAECFIKSEFTTEKK